MTMPTNEANVKLTRWELELLRDAIAVAADVDDDTANLYQKLTLALKDKEHPWTSQPKSNKGE
jgi:hypothetical protein